MPSKFIVFREQNHALKECLTWCGSAGKALAHKPKSDALNAHNKLGTHVVSEM